MNSKKKSICNHKNGTTSNELSKAHEDEETSNEERGKANDTSEDDGLPIDRGWAWVILAGCFLNATLIVGYNRSLALFFVEFLEMFQASAATTTMIMAVKSFSYSIFSLVTMHVTLEYLGTRKTVMVGGVLFSSSILAASFAPNIAVLICLHFVLGIGHSMLHSPGLVLISKYFKKRRSLATTTASSAISFSAAVYPMFSEYLLDEYGIRGAMLIVAGLTMNLWVGASIYRPLESFKRKTTSSVGNKEETEPMIDNRVGANVKENGNVDCRKHHLGDQSGNSCKMGVDEVVRLSRSADVVDKNYLSPDVDETFRRRTFSEGSKYKHNIPVSYNLAYASDDDFIVASMTDMQGHIEENNENERNNKKSTVLRNLRKILKAFDFSLFKKPLFLLITSFSFVGVMVRMTQIYLPARVNELGLTQSDAAILLLITGIVDFFCRIFYGFLADLKILKVHQIMAIGLVITGLTSQFITFYTTFPLLVAYSVINGLFGSAYQCLLPVVIVEFLGTECLAKTLGFVALFQGFAMGVTHPIIGGIRDLSGSYAGCYNFVGTSSFVAAALLMCEPLVRRYERKTVAEKEGDEVIVSQNKT